jgi:Ni/Co efflux regulator RcnB
MRKFILLAAMAATIVPTAALAQQQTTRQNRTQVRANQHTVKANRQTVRSNQRVARSNQNVARSNQNVASSNQRVARSNQQVARTNQRATAQRARSAYVAPVRNWSYRPVNVGYQLQPSFYGPRYYISNYGAYHLQAPHGRWLRWIRYGNDLLLVNIRTGRVLQVIHYAGW